MPRPENIDVIYIPASTDLSFLDLGTFIVEVRKLERKPSGENREADQIAGLLKQELECLIERKRSQLERMKELKHKIQEAEATEEEDEISSKMRPVISRLFGTLRPGGQDRDLIAEWQWELLSLVRSLETNIDLRIEFLQKAVGGWKL